MKVYRYLNWLLLLLYILIIADFVVSIFWSGFAQTASGITIPDSSLIVPIIIFILITVIQTICFFRKTGTLVNFIFIIVKAFSMLVTLWITNSYVFNAKYYSGSDIGYFYSNIYNTVIITVFAALIFISIIVEFVRMLCVRKRQEERQC